MVGPHCTERPDARKQDTMSDKARLWVYSPSIVYPAAAAAADARIFVAEKPSIFSTYVAVVESFPSATDHRRRIIADVELDGFIQ